MTRMTRLERSNSGRAGRVVMLEPLGLWLVDWWRDWALIGAKREDDGLETCLTPVLKRMDADRD